MPLPHEGRPAALTIPTWSTRPSSAWRSERGGPLAGRAAQRPFRRRNAEIPELASLGWKAHFAAQAAAFDDRFLPLRVAVSYGNRILALGEGGEHSLELPGSFLRELSSRNLSPVTGDWILAEALRGQGGGVERTEEGLPRALARVLLPRATDFSRKAPISGGRRIASFQGEDTLMGGETLAQSIAANVDRVFIVTAPGAGARARIAERYLVVVRASGAEPVLVLNKTDLVADLEAELAVLRAVARGVPVIGTSALRGEGLAPLLALVRAGETVALVGKSGVGKSALVNALAGESRQATGEVNAVIGKGRHTTTRRELVLLPGGGILVDTPGMRELQLWGDESILDGEFDEIAEFATACRFGDCRHRGEPGCAVEAALAEGRLDRARWESYGRMKRELALLEVRKEQRSRVVDLDAAVRESRYRRAGKGRPAGRRFRAARGDGEED